MDGLAQVTATRHICFLRGINHWPVLKIQSWQCLACGRSAQATARPFAVRWKFHLDKAVIPLFIAMRSRAACFRPMTNAPQLLCYGVRLFQGRYPITNAIHMLYQGYREMTR